MRVLSLLVLVSAGVLALPFSDTPGWTPQGPHDARSPCPLLNTLANHNILPHNGRNITLPMIETAFKNYINMGNDVAVATGSGALSLSPTPGSFDLDVLDAHNAIEHDGSLSRNDAFWGNDYSFNAAIYGQTKSYFTKPTIDIATAAKARFARVATAKLMNPSFNMTAAGITGSFTETPFYLSVFGCPSTGIARTQWVNVFFEQERLPYLEGWTPRDDETNFTTLGAMAQQVMAATPAFISPPDWNFDIQFGKFHW